VIIRVNMTTKEVQKVKLPEKYTLLGGRGITSRLILDEVEPLCNPLGPQNKLIIAPGLLAGTAAPSSGRISIGAKSPLTGGIKESNGGGTAGAKLGKLGVRALVIEGQPQEQGFFILKITGEKIEIIPAEELNDLGNYETAKILLDKYGWKNSVISIGPAGERGYNMASVAITDMAGNPARHCGRGGMGAVLGSKKIKAIVIDDSQAQGITYKDESKFKKISQQWAQELVETKKVLTDLGTANLVKPINSLGALPTKNFSWGTFAEAEKISGEQLKAIIEERGGKPSHSCQPGCVIRCSNVYKDQEGNYLTSALEYETIGLLGPNCGISDYDFIAQLDRFCDDFGIDTMELGVTIGVMMEANILPFGDQEKILDLLEELKNDTLMGKLMGQGALITGKVLRVKRIPTVKGQGLSSYDPRGLKATGVTYATTPMGGDHTAGNCLPGRTGYREKTKNLDYLQEQEGMLELSKDLQVMTTVCDYAGLCFFVGPTPENLAKVTQLLNAKLGTELTFADVIALAERLIKVEIEFNKKVGLVQEGNDLPEFFRTEKLGPYDHIFDIPQEKLINFYE